MQWSTCLSIQSTDTSTCTCEPHDLGSRSSWGSYGFGSRLLGRFYRDFLAIECSSSEKCVVFRIRNKLEYFANEYNPKSKSDVLRLEFASAQDVARIQKEIMPKIKGLAGI